MSITDEDWPSDLPLWLSRLSGGPVLFGLLAAAASLPTAFLTSALLPVVGALVLAGSAGRRGNSTLPTV